MISNLTETSVENCSQNLKPNIKQTLTCIKDGQTSQMVGKDHHTDSYLLSVCESTIGI